MTVEIEENTKQNRFRILIQTTYTQEFFVQADDLEEAQQLADDGLPNGEFADGVEVGADVFIYDVQEA